MKVGYRKLNGYISTAYLDDDWDDRPGNVYTGEDKYTELPVTVRWTGEEWVELDTSQGSPA